MRQRTAELVAVPAGNEPCDRPALLARDDDHRCLDVRSVGILDERKPSSRHFAGPHLGRAHAIRPRGASCPARREREKAARGGDGELQERPVCGFLGIMFPPQSLYIPGAPPHGSWVAASRSTRREGSTARIRLFISGPSGIVALARDDIAPAARQDRVGSGRGPALARNPKYLNLINIDSMGSPFEPRGREFDEAREARQGRRRAAAKVPSEARDSWLKAANNRSGATDQMKTGALCSRFFSLARLMKLMSEGEASPRSMNCAAAAPNDQSNSANATKASVIDTNRKSGLACSADAPSNPTSESPIGDTELAFARFVKSDLLLNLERRSIDALKRQTHRKVGAQSHRSKGLA